MRVWALVALLALTAQERGPEPPRFPANPKNLPPIAPPPGDDWTQFGHDARRTNLSKDSLDAPFFIAWTYAVELPAQSVSTAVASAGYLHLNATATGNGAGTSGGMRNPWLITLNGLTGEYRGMYSPEQDLCKGEWLGVFDDFNVLYNDGAFGTFDCRTFVDRRWVQRGRWGSVAIEESQKAILHVNDLAGEGDPPMVEMHGFDGRQRWRDNVWPVKRDDGRMPVHEVNISGATSLAAVRYTGRGKGAPVDGLYAFDTMKGTRLWSIPGKYRNLCSDAKRVYALDDDGAMHAIDLKDGREAWKANLGEVAGTPGLYQERIVALLTSNRLVAMETADGKIAWSARVEGSGANKNRLTSMVLSAQGRALVCTPAGFALYDLAKGAKAAAWVAEGGQQRRGQAAELVNPIVARGMVYLCGPSSVTAVFTGTFLREQTGHIEKAADLARKTGRISFALRAYLALAGTEGVKESVRKSAADDVAAITREADRDFAEVAKAKARGHLLRALSLCDELAEKYAGLDVAKKAAEESAALTTILINESTAADAGFKEAQSYEEQGKKKEAVQLYKLVMERWPETDGGKKAAVRYKALQGYDKDREK